MVCRPTPMTLSARGGYSTPYPCRAEWREDVGHAAVGEIDLIGGGRSGVVSRHIACGWTDFGPDAVQPGIYRVPTRRWSGGGPRRMILHPGQMALAISMSSAISPAQHLDPAVGSGDRFAVLIHFFDSSRWLVCMRAGRRSNGTWRDPPRHAGDRSCAVDRWRWCPAARRHFVRRPRSLGRGLWGAASTWMSPSGVTRTLE